MAAPRLSDAQRQELVSRFRSGSSTQELADAYGCSPNTVIRVVKAALEPSVYESLKRQRGRRSASADAAMASAETPLDDGAGLVAEPSPDAALSVAEAQQEDSAGPVADPPEPSAAQAAEVGEALPEPVADQPADHTAADSGLRDEGAMGLAIDDADDFDGDEDEGEDDPEDEEELDGADALTSEAFVEVPVVLHELLDQPLTTPRPWIGAEIPDSVYMLVDKTVELQARPLAEIPELGRLAPEEEALQALVLYSNPRQAKRQCGRTQRVIKLPDTTIFERTASYLRKQGIERLVIEGALYALPQG